MLYDRKRETTLGRPSRGGTFTNSGGTLPKGKATLIGIIEQRWEHEWLDDDILLVSLMGVIAFFGVGINDSLIMIDYANCRRGENAGLVDAI